MSPRMRMQVAKDSSDRPPNEFTHFSNISLASALRPWESRKFAKTLSQRGSPRRYCRAVKIWRGSSRAAKTSGSEWNTPKMTSIDAMSNFSGDECLSTSSSVLRESTYAVLLRWTSASKSRASTSSEVPSTPPAMTNCRARPQMSTACEKSPRPMQHSASSWRASVSCWKFPIRPANH
ncbi:hypothetical protein B0H11DRAFT_2068171 [Mycena galericulata]|nr:hypothetical protein B0H11DRAFT_2068171 [Mycena galericulata]